MIEIQLKNREAIRNPGEGRFIPTPALYAIYAIALAASISIWFIALHAPLRQDETGSFWIINGGFVRVWNVCFRSTNFPTYYVVLWLSSKILGTSEVALRVPSILAMLGAVWLLYLAARELFSRELSLVAAVIFCLHPVVVFTSVDIRPYAFAVLATNAAILVLLRMRRSNSMWLAALFGLLAAVIVSFHFLFALVLPAFVVCFFLIKTGNRKVTWRQFGAALVVFALAFLPMIPGLKFLFHTGAAHVYELPPRVGDLISALAPLPLLFATGGVMLVAPLLAAFKADSADSKEPPQQQGTWRIWASASLGLIPLFTLYGLSATTSLHIFIFQHRLSAVPGLAFCWAWLIARYFKTTAIRLVFCITLIVLTAFLLYRSPFIREHSFSRKYALETAQKIASVDNAPVLVCSGFVESKFAAMPLDSPKTSQYFAPLSYYKLTVPVVPMPWGLNDEAKRVGSQFLTQATQKHQRFLAVASDPSYETLDWLSKQASSNYSVRDLGTFDTVKVWEFDPRAAATPPAAHSSDQRPRPFVKEASRPAMR